MAPVKIEQYNEDILVQVFNSVADAAHWCVDNGYAKTYNGGVRSHISNAAKHKHTDIDGSMHNSSHLRNHIIHK